jgi:hypothetical protein
MTSKTPAAWLALYCRAPAPPPAPVDPVRNEEPAAVLEASSLDALSRAVTAGIGAFPSRRPGELIVEPLAAEDLAGAHDRAQALEGELLAVYALAWSPARDDTVTAASHPGAFGVRLELVDDDDQDERGRERIDGFAHDPANRAPAPTKAGNFPLLGTEETSLAPAPAGGRVARPPRAPEAIAARAGQGRAPRGGSIEPEGAQALEDAAEAELANQLTRAAAGGDRGDGEVPGLRTYRGHIFAPSSPAPALMTDVQAWNVAEALALLQEWAGEGGQVFGVWDDTGAQVYAAPPA